MARVRILKQLIEELGLAGPIPFEKEIGASNGSVWRLIKKDQEEPTEISAALIARIRERYPNVSKEWLKTGKGSIRINESLPHDADPTENRSELSRLEMIEIRMIADFVARLVEDGVTQFDPAKHIPMLKKYADAYLKGNPPGS